METDVWDASNSFSVEGNSLALDPDQYDTDIDDIPDPGLLEEKNGEVAWPKSRPHSGTGSVHQEQGSQGSPLTHRALWRADLWGWLGTQCHTVTALPPLARRVVFLGACLSAFYQELTVAKHDPTCARPPAVAPLACRPA